MGRGRPGWGTCGRMGVGTSKQKDTAGKGHSGKGAAECTLQAKGSKHSHTVIESISQSAAACMVAYQIGQVQ
eukprot:scaffold648773_cov41-Prasinocladus_malaysianus.AAC.1